MTPPGRSARRPRLLSILLAVGGVVGAGVSAVLGNVTGNLLSELSVAVLGSASLGLAAIGVVATFVVEWRRRQREQLLTDDDGETAATSSAPTLPWPAGYTGRRGQAEAVVAMLAPEHAVAVVGRRAVGTSWCTIQAANLSRTDFPDGQFYLDLRRGGRARSPRQVLTALARILGTAAPRSGRPDDLADAADELRGQLDGRKVLLVLDNVDSPAQVRPLLPPTARDCRLLLAGTGRLAAVDGVVAYWLAEPDVGDAVEMFADAGAATAVARPHRPDPRTDPAVRTIVELCGRQPRTVTELGRRTAQHGWRHADVLHALRRAADTPPHQRVGVSPVTGLVTARDTAYHALSGQARRLWRLLSLSPVPLDRATIAALAGRRPHRIAALLDELADGAFVVGAPGDRYEVRPLLAAYARMHLREAEPVHRRVTVQARLTRHLARRAEQHMAGLGMAGVLDRDHRLPDDDPYGWLDLHQELLLAVVKVPAGAVEALPRRVRDWWFRLAVALCGWLAHVERRDEWEEVCQTVLANPSAQDRPEIAGWAHNELGVLRRRRHDPYGAVAALSLAVAGRGRRGTAQARMNLGLALLDLGRTDEAVEHLELSRRHRAGADRAGQALSDLGLGAARLARGELEAAHDLLVRAANTFRSLGDSRGYAAALTNLVLVHSAMGEHLDAAQAWRAALREYETVGDPTNRAAALLNAGAALLGVAPGQARQAYGLLAESRRLREGGRPDAGLGRTLLHLGDAAAALGDDDEARRHWVDAAAICELAGDEDGQRVADARLGGERSPESRPGVT
ncbi:tetratricopeptide repeat protein [Micromonospora sp. WMMD1082]|uniref:tetratricopeptide repeat protein n=1 Tax=Micromonospora sp. WMMD1082 TaxID=3016104 RepID=UPI0024169A9C|nr:tetratricopeptide repeat protein [Micromonospora sp. WMMD1082]MDG4797624.1 tetratricopeptide repeat protein [Micromonospora sp. WMMD1082]